MSALYLHLILAMSATPASLACLHSLTCQPLRPHVPVCTASHVCFPVASTTC
jgi:hypothetical protein